MIVFKFTKPESLKKKLVLCLLGTTLIIPLTCLTGNITFNFLCFHKSNKLQNYDNEMALPTYVEHPENEPVNK